MALSTISNAESSPHRVIARDAALRITYFFGLDDATSKEFMALWEETPLSEFSKSRRAYWEKRNALRNKARASDGDRAALVELLGLHLMALPDAEVCACDFGTVCGVCAALGRVGLGPFTPADRDRILAQLVKIREKMAPASAPSA